MLPRHISTTIQRLAQSFPVITITGPRQSGKTTLARALFADKAYVSLEDPVERTFAEEDPRGFLARFATGAVFDEAQRWRDLLSTLQGMVDLDRTPKLYFVDTGLACWLLGIGNTSQLALHPMRGALFENWVVTEHVKQRYNQGLPAGLYFWRDNNGVEADLLYETPTGQIQTVEIKSGQTPTTDYIRARKKSASFVTENTATPRLIYGGDASFLRSGVEVVGWRDACT